MNANELADEFQNRQNWKLLNYIHWSEQSETMLRQQEIEIERITSKYEEILHEQQAEIEALKSEIEELKLAKKVILRYAEKDIAKYRAEVEELKKQLALWRLSKSSEEIEQVPTNPTLMGGLAEPVGHFYPEGEGATVYDIKFAWKVTGTTEPIPLYTHPAKTLTDNEILALWAQKNNLNGAKDVVDFSRALLRKAQKK